MADFIGFILVHCIPVEDFCLTQEGIVVEDAPSASNRRAVV